MLGIMKKIKGWKNEQMKLNRIRNEAYQKELGKIKAKELVDKEERAEQSGKEAARNEKGKWTRRLKTIGSVVESVGINAESNIGEITMGQTDSFDLQGVTASYDGIGKIDDIFLDE